MEKVNTSALRILGLLSGFFLFMGSALAQTTQDANKSVALTDNLTNSQINRDSNPPITLQLDQMPLKEALKRIANLAQAGLYYDSSLLPDKTLSLDLQAVPLSKALRKVLAGTSLNVVTSGRNITLRKQRKIDQVLLSFAKTQETISGTVTDGESGDTLPGVNILVKGTSTGTSTDAQGGYELTVESLQDTLVFSFIGYQTQQVPINGQMEVNVILQPQTFQGEEMVVVGYGEVRRSDLTGSVSSVSAESFESQPTQRMEEVLQGRATGVSVTNQSGAPGGDIRVRIRGINSITGNNDPLYIVDGVENKDLFSVLDPDDIQSIEVLKDASATAIYGSRGANGVVLVTTKEGVEGETQIEFKTEQSWSNVTNLYEMLDAATFAGFYNQFRRDKGSTVDFYSQDEIQNWEQNGGTDWQKLMFRTAYSQDYKLNVSGGSENIQYYIAGNIQDSEGTLVNSSYQNYGIRSNLNADVAEWLDVDLKLNAHRTSAKNNLTRGGGGSPIRTALIYSPTVALFEENGNWARDNVSSLATNPYGERMQSTANDDASSYVTGNTKFNFYLPVEGLELSVQGAADYRSLERYALSSKERNLDTQNNASSNQNKWFDWQITNQLNYSTDWGDHSITALVATEFISENTSNNSFAVTQLATESAEYWNLGLGSIDTFGNQYTQTNLASYLGRINYNLMDKYLFTGTLRYDGSSKFQGDNKWGYFPSVALAWNIDNESFISDLNIFDRLSLRTSWGVSGSQAIAPYSTLGLLQEANYGWGTSNPIAGYWAANFASPDLSWEKTSQWNFGLDFAFLDNRLSGSTNVFFKETEDLLLNTPLPLHIGGGTVLRNTGQVNNKGIELNLTIVPVRSSTTHWESAFNITYSQNEVVDLGGDERIFPGDTFGGDNTINMAVLEVGEPMGSIWGYEWLGLWGTDEAEEAAEYGQQPGDNKFLDRNNDSQYSSEDLGIIGQAFPNYSFGWNNTISWNRLNLSIFFTGAVGADRLNVTRQGMSEIISEARFITSAEGYFDRWTPDNQDTDIPNHFSGTVQSKVESTQYLESADFIKLKNLSMGYTFPIIPNSSTEATISLSAQNLFTITSYSGYDPEVSTNTGNGDTNAGIDFGSYPTARTFTVGIGIKL